MKKLLFVFYAIFFLQTIFLAQHNPKKVIQRYQQDSPPFVLRQLTHPQGLASSTKSFYKSKGDWQKIIDSTWGSGLPLKDKLAVFDSYVSALSKEFDGFASLGFDWDSLKSVYRSNIDSTTSRGKFSSIMTQFANNLRDSHTFAMDTVVTFTPLSPGVPILVLNSFASVEHFGAVLTALPDTTAVVLKTIENHPLGLEPGDVILGYDGKPWWDILQELLEAKLPINGWGAGSKSADFDHMVRSVGMNWHLFDTIDVRKYSNKQVQHLSVNPLLSLPPTPLFGNEQLELPGISSAYCYALPWTSFTSAEWGKPVSYGKINETTIGYIQIVVEVPSDIADQPFLDAINSLWDTQGLIIDLRWNIGGWSLFKEAFAKLFNQKFLTIEDAYRTGPSSWNLTPSGDSEVFSISGSSESIYDHPIAVLVGPSCESMGDIIAQWFRYHPMVRFFGKPPAASMGDNKELSTKDWILHYSISDMFHLNQPEVYLNRSEFPIDFPVWHNPDDVAAGKDAVVEAAVNWINNLVYGHDLTKNTGYCPPGVDNLKISALVENPNSHQTSSKVYIKNLTGSFIDSLELTRSDRLSYPEIWLGNYAAPDSEDIFNVSLSAKDIDESKTWTTDNITRFTTAGPVVLDSISIDTSNSFSYTYDVKLFLRNESKIATIKNASVKLTSNDSWIAGILGTNNLSDIYPGTAIRSSTFRVQYIDSLFKGYFNFKVEIMSDGWIYWTDSRQVKTTPVVAITKLVNHPLTFKLEQNYPNPFNPSTTVKYSIPKQSLVTLKVYDLLGREVAILVNEEKPAGNYEIVFNTQQTTNNKQLSSGIYFYQLKAGNFTATKKLLLLK